MIFVAVISYSTQLVMWPLSYWEDWGVWYRKIWIAYRDVWQYTRFLAGAGTIWVMAAMIMSGKEDYGVKNFLSTEIGVVLCFYSIYEGFSFFFMWNKMPFIALFYEWNGFGDSEDYMFDNEEARTDYINEIWGRPDEEEEL